MRAALLALLLAGCASTTVCPVISEYPYEFQQRLAAEIEPLPDDSAIMRALLDYQRTRDELRQCQ